MMDRCAMLSKESPPINGAILIVWRDNKIHIHPCVYV